MTGPKKPSRRDHQASPSFENLGMANRLTGLLLSFGILDAHWQTLTDR
jgi:hypothetical protein